jgi:hypothetical protein
MPSDPVFKSVLISVSLPAPEKMQDHHDHGRDQKQVDEAAGDMGKQANYPKDNEKNTD